MKRGLQARPALRRVPGEPFKSFVPKPLPPDPPLVLDTALHDLLERLSFYFKRNKARYYELRRRRGCPSRR